MANILLVDDDLENLWSLRVALESEGHRVCVAGDAQRALDLLQDEPVQLLITDYEMPGTDGAQLCGLVRAQPAHAVLPIAMLSAAPEPRNVPRLWTRFLRKPASFKDLLTFIETHVAVRQLRRAYCVSSAASLMCADRAASRWAAVDIRTWP
jgi:DNA-binding response OmpR family regulator